MKLLFCPVINLVLTKFITLMMTICSGIWKRIVNGKLARSLSRNSVAYIILYVVRL